jgi:large subunit ribosomal protein L25
MVYEFKSEKREQGEKKEKFVPAVVYGSEVKENPLIFIHEVDFKKLYDAAGESSIINLGIAGEKEPREVLIKDVTWDVVKDQIIHVDFYQIKRGQTLDVSIELNFVGEAPAEKALGGILVKSMDELNVRCRPADMISEIKVDLTVLDSFDKKIQVKDLNLPEGLEVMGDMDDVVMSVSEPRVEEEKPVVAEAVEGEEGEEVKAEDGDKPAEGGKPAEASEKKE